MNAVFQTPKRITLPLAKINAIPECQPRAKIDEKLVKEYMEEMKQGIAFPPLRVCFDGKHYWLYDGFHRRLAAIKAGWESHAAEIQDGTRRDAILFSLQQNAEHGMRRTIADKRRSVETMLRDPEWSGWNDSEIARQCNVSHSFVSKLSKIFPRWKDSEKNEGKSVTYAKSSTGKTYAINTENIGKKKVDDPTQQEPQEPQEQAQGQDLPPSIELVAQSQPASLPDDPSIPSYILLDDWLKLPESDRQIYVHGIETDKSFNRQSNDSIEWAQWSWNPITGCRHDCVYCYARDIAIRFYEQKFEPSFVPDRIRIPGNMKVPEQAKSDPSYKNVFTCSMADLFGRWVPKEWIKAVLQQVWENPQWDFLFLTKFPKRMAEFEFPKNAWMGTTVDCQARVKAAEDAFEKISGGTKWLSIEPLLQPIKFTRLELFHWLAIGGSSKSTQTPEWIPPFDWVSDLHQQARAAGCRIYHKANLGLVDGMRLKEFPWIEPKVKELPEQFKYLPSLKG